MYLLISGSRDFPHLDMVRNYVNSLPPNIILLNGRARGVDNVARNTALFNDIIVQDYSADWNKYGKPAGIIRNHKMVDLADKVVCFWDSKSPGTKDVIDYTLSKNKHLIVYNEYGQKEEFNVSNI